MSDDAPTQNALQNVIAQAEKADSGNAGLPPVHLWEPDYCGDIGCARARRPVVLCRFTDWQKAAGAVVFHDFAS